MSLLRACSEALAKPGLLRSSLTVRALSTRAIPPAPTATKESSEIAPIPQKDVVSADIISGAPGTAVPLIASNRITHNMLPLGELRHRVVRIFQPTRNTMQSGGAKGKRWRLDWDILPGGGRWENPLMGWASSYGLPLQNMCVLSLTTIKGGLRSRNPALV
jgi:NADH dehydrogenase (ubiquinone) Fe-S protein 4